MYSYTEKYFQIKTVGKSEEEFCPTADQGWCVQVLGLLMQIYTAINGICGNLFSAHSFLDFFFFCVTI